MNFATNASSLTKSSQFQGLFILVGITSALATTSCGWEQKLQFDSPDRTASIRVLQPYLRNSSGLGIVLRLNNDEKDLYRGRSDVFLFFAEVYWSPDKSKVAVMTCGNPSPRVAYDIQTSKNLPFDQ